MMGQQRLLISNGTHLVMKGQPSMVMQNISWENNGQFTADSGLVIFTGTNEDSLLGSSVSTFFQIRLNKPTSKLVMGQDQQVDDTLYFVNGLFDLNGKDLTLGTAEGGLSGETEATRMIGPAGGELVKVLVLNSPTDENPGNMGFTINSSASLGSTIVRRGHTPQTIQGIGSINRYYQLIPSTNSGLDAQVRMTYFDAELNGLPEADLDFYFNTNALGGWTDIGYAAFNTGSNYLEQSGLDALGFFTANSPGSFPVEWLSFDAIPEGNTVLCQWLTASEINSDHYIVERSVDGQNFEGFATVQAAGNSQQVLAYEAVDFNPYEGRSYYRVKQVDLDGSFDYAPQVAVYFAPSLKISLFPNPAEDVVYVDMALENDDAVQFAFLDMRGRTVMKEQRQLDRGAYKIPLNISRLAEGIYTLTVKTTQGYTSLRVMVL